MNLTHFHSPFSLSSQTLVTVPQGVNPGDTIHVQAPDGRLNAVVVPPGMVSGSTFTVQFAASLPPTQVGTTASSNSMMMMMPTPPTKYENPPVAFSAPITNSSGWNDNGHTGVASPHYATSSAQVIPNDDFASGFGSNGRSLYNAPQASIATASSPQPSRVDDFASGFGSNARPY
jgi:hypothetical protein